MTKVYSATNNSNPKGVLNEDGKAVAGREVFSYMIDLYKIKEISITTGLRDSRHPGDTNVYKELKELSEQARDVQKARASR